MDKTESTQNVLSHLGFQRVQPGACLARFVDCYWYIDSSQANSQSSLKGYTEYLNPDGGTGIVFNLSGEFTVGEQTVSEDALFDGALTSSEKIVLPAQFCALGVRFKPGGVSVFTDLSINEVGSARCHIREVFGVSSDSLVEQLSNASNLSARINLVEGWLKNRLCEPSRGQASLFPSVSYIRQSNGMVSVNELSRNISISPRTIERVFKLYLGMTPKEYARICRVRSAMPILKRSTVSLCELALELGYHDQAHFSKHFKMTLGITPGSYRKLAKPH